MHVCLFYSKLLMKYVEMYRFAEHLSDHRCERINMAVNLKYWWLSLKIY